MITLLLVMLVMHTLLYCCILLGIKLLLLLVAQLRAVPKLADMELSQILVFRGQEPTISFQWVSARKM